MIHMPQFNGPAVEAKNALFALVQAIAADANIRLDNTKYVRLVSDVVDGIYAEAVEDAIDFAGETEPAEDVEEPEDSGKPIYECVRGSLSIAVYECVDGEMLDDPSEGGAGTCRFEIRVNGEPVASASSQMEAEQEVRRLVEAAETNEAPH